MWLPGIDGGNACSARLVGGEASRTNWRRAHGAFSWNVVVNDLYFIKTIEELGIEAIVLTEVRETILGSSHTQFFLRSGPNCPQRPMSIVRQQRAF